jgi:hypothetical protein
MPLLRGKENIGSNVKTEEAAGKPKAQAVAIALHEAGVKKSVSRDMQPAAATSANSGIPHVRRAADGTGSVPWTGRTV